MTFVTPTLLAGDKSLAGVVAHEIAHSWTGNLVTCASWDDFWLNEGWTVWLERKIASRLHGPQYLDFEAIGGYADLKDAMAVMPEEFQSLVLPIGDLDPDDAYSTIAYEKGFNFLLYLERKVGTDKFEAFFQAYIKHFASKTLTSEEFREFFVNHFATDDTASAAIQDVDWKTWYYAPGMPPEVVEYDRSLAEASEDLANKWMQVDAEGIASYPLVNVDSFSWSSKQITCFLDALLTLTAAAQPLKVTTLSAMNQLYGFADSRNSEILLRYCRLAIAAEDKSILPATIRFITSQGRMKFIRPLYKALYQSEMGKDLAVTTFLEHKDFYHPIGAKMVASDLMVENTKAVGESKQETSKDTTTEVTESTTKQGENGGTTVVEKSTVAVVAEEGNAPVNEAIVAEKSAVAADDSETPANGTSSNEAAVTEKSTVVPEESKTPANGTGSKEYATTTKQSAAVAEESKTPTNYTTSKEAAAFTDTSAVVAEESKTPTNVSSEVATPIIEKGAVKDPVVIEKHGVVADEESKTPTNDNKSSKEDTVTKSTRKPRDSSESNDDQKPPGLPGIAVAAAAAVVVVAAITLMRRKR